MTTRNWGSVRMPVMVPKAGPLLRSALPVSKVADLVGYASEAAFSQAFKREFGLSPTQWRQQRAEPREAALTAQDSGD